MRKHKFLNIIVGPTNQNVWVSPDVGPTQISHESTWVPHMGPILTYCGSRMNNIHGMWMIRASMCNPTTHLFLMTWRNERDPPTLGLVKMRPFDCEWCVIPYFVVEVKII
jgi:hypothetical protein